MWAFGQILIVSLSLGFLPFGMTNIFHREGKAVRKCDKYRHPS